jgi:hypothetical protein
VAKARVYNLYPNKSHSTKSSNQRPQFQSEDFTLLLQRTLPQVESIHRLPLSEPLKILSFPETGERTKSGGYDTILMDDISSIKK